MWINENFGLNRLPTLKPIIQWIEWFSDAKFIEVRIFLGLYANLKI